MKTFDIRSEIETFKELVAVHMLQQWMPEDYKSLDVSDIYTKTEHWDQEKGIIQFSFRIKERDYDYTLVAFYHSANSGTTVTGYYLHHAVLQDDGDWIYFLPK